MNRRKFLQFLGLSPLAVAAAKLLPKTESLEAVYSKSLESSEAFYTWQPNRNYEVGDIILINGEKHRVVWAGTSGETQPPKSEWHRLDGWYHGRGQSGYEVDLIDKTVGYKKI